MILEALVSSQICTIQHLKIDQNSSWFANHSKRENRDLGIIDMLAEIISNQTSCLQILNLSYNCF